MLMLILNTVRSGYWLCAGIVNEAFIRFSEAK